MSENRDYCVYVHIFDNDNKYIGITNNPDRRFKRGFNINNNTGLAIYVKGKTYNEYVINAYNHHGLKKTALLYDGLSREEAYLLEVEEIKNHNTLNTWAGGSNSKGLNFTKGGEGGNNLKGENSSCSKLTQNQVYVIKLRLAMGDLHREILKDFNISSGSLSDINHGRTWVNDDTIYPINPNCRSESLSGKNHPFFGKHQSDESKKKISEHFKGRYTAEKSYIYDNGKYSKELKEKAILLTFLGFNREFICDLLSIESVGNISGWKKGRSIGSINLDDLKLVSDYFKANTPLIYGLIRCLV